MRDTKRIKRILRLIEDKWTDSPDLRLFQLLENAICNDPIRQETYQYEDDELEKRLAYYLQHGRPAPVDLE